MAEISLTLASDLPDEVLADLTRDLRIALLQNGFSEPTPAGRQVTGERGDPVTAFVKCVQAVLAKDRTLRIKLKTPREIEIDARNIATADLHAAIKAAVAALER
ncbi:MAG: hypothetical protein ACJ8AW_24110 [Rhodopila sp.]|jgi:hypothetical protein